MPARLLKLALAASLMIVASALAAETESTATVTSPIVLFNSRDLTGFKPYLDPKTNAKPEDVWSVDDGVLICKGKPFGYLRTEKDYGNYVLHVDWRWPKDTTATGRNSGVFVHVTGEETIWPKGVEAQLMSGHAGDFWLVGNYRLEIDAARRDPKTERHYFRTEDNVEKPIGEWNSYEITCRDREIIVKINGKEVNRGTNAETGHGSIVLQSEGAEIHFRNVRLEPLQN